MHSMPEESYGYAHGPKATVRKVTNHGRSTLQLTRTALQFWVFWYCPNVSLVYRLVANQTLL